MYKLQKRITYPIGHRLSKNDNLCINTHGHEFEIIIGIKSEVLDNNDMVIDFSVLKKYIKIHLDKFDHGLMLNKQDPLIREIQKGSDRVILFNGDPTAEQLSKYIYDSLEHEFEQQLPSIQMDFVTVFENKNSSATYDKN